MTRTIENILHEGKLEKGKIFLLKDPGDNGLDVNMKDAITVQFNPSEYQIARSLRTGKKRALGRDQRLEQLQSICGEFATLTLVLYFDEISDLTNNSSLNAIQWMQMDKMVALKAMASKLKTMKKAIEDRMENGKKKPSECAKLIAGLLRYNDELHAPLRVRFKWGKLDFIGYITSSTIAYTMFSPDGTPVRAKVDLTITGEEVAVFQKIKQKTFCSPDRTKERTLTEGDQLWMLAQQEYNDPAFWREIAAANGILNPRRLNSAMALKLPAIK